MILSLNYILLITLTSFRFLGMIIAMPLFSISSIPTPVKVILSLALAMVFVPFQPKLPPEIWDKNQILFLIIGREIGIGLIIGYIARFLFLAISMGLEFAGLQIGFAMANMFDPQNNAQISVLAQLGVTMMVLFFFATNMHHDFFVGLIKSYELIPLGLPEWKMGTLFKNLVYFLSSSFEIALRLSLPIMVSMLTIHFILGIIGRTAPQMNLFFNIAFIVNVFVGLILVIIMMPLVFPFIQNLFERMRSHGFGLF